MLKVLKRSGDTQPFDKVKIQNVIALASDGIKKPMGAGEISNISKDVERKLGTDGSVTSRDVYDRVIEVLRDWGYSEVADAYINDAGNQWNEKNK